MRNIFENLEESIANDRRNASNGFSLLVALVDGRTCVSLALEIPVPNDGRPDREGRGYLVSFAQVRDMVEPLAHRVRLHIGISTTANKGCFVSVLRHGCLPARTGDTAGKNRLHRARP